MNKRHVSFTVPDKNKGAFKPDDRMLVELFRSEQSLSGMTDEVLASEIESYMDKYGDPIRAGIPLSDLELATRKSWIIYSLTDRLALELSWSMFMFGMFILGRHVVTLSTSGSPNDSDDADALQNSPVKASIAPFLINVTEEERVRAASIIDSTLEQHGFNIGNVVADLTLPVNTSAATPTNDESGILRDLPGGFVE